MSTELATISGGLTREQIDLVKRTVAKDATDDELALFLHHCKTTGLDPLSNQIYWIKRGGVGRPEMSIGGARAVADDTGRYRPGSTIYYDAEGKQYDVWTQDTPPTAVRVTVFKDGFEVPGKPVRFSERVQNLPTWKSMPATMLAKCAEMDTLRNAFPQKLGGIYTPEEMGHMHPPRIPESKGGAPLLEITPDPPELGGAKITKALTRQVNETLDGMIADGADRSSIDARLVSRYGTAEVEQWTKTQAEDLLARVAEDAS